MSGEEEAAGISAEFDKGSPPAPVKGSNGKPPASASSSRGAVALTGTGAPKVASRGAGKGAARGTMAGGSSNSERGAGGWAQGLGSVIVAAGWGEVGAVLPDVRHWKLLRSQMKLVLKKLPLLERAGIGALAGGLAGGFTNATLHPIDTVKTKLQAKGAGAVYSGPIDVIKQLSATQGLAGFYRGLPAAIVGSFVSSAIYFGTYELCKGLLSQPLHLPPLVLPFNPLSTHRGLSVKGRGGAEGSGASRQGLPCAGRGVTLRLPPLLIPPLSAALGNVASSAILVPKEVIKQRLQSGASGTSLGVLQVTLREEGLRGLYAGYYAALLRNLPTNVINFSLFEYLKAAVLALSRSGDVGAVALRPWQSVLCGGVAGFTSSAVTTPLDVVKTRLMTQARASVTHAGLVGAKAEAAAKAQAAAAYTFAAVSSTMASVLKEEGIKGLTKGMGARILYGACFSAVGFFSYEAARMFLLRAHLERKLPRLLNAQASEDYSIDEIGNFRAKLTGVSGGREHS